MFLNRQSGWALVGIAGVAAALLALQPKPAGPQDKAGTARGPDRMAGSDNAKQPTPGEGGPLQPIRDFFAASPETPAASVKHTLKVSFKEGALALEEETRDDEAGFYSDTKPPPAPVHFLLATVPDPVDSGFDYVFDQVVEAMQRALETEDFVIDRSWLPWRRPAPGTVGGRPSRLQERHPGLLLFRRSPRPKPALGAGIVGLAASPLGQGPVLAAFALIPGSANGKVELLALLLVGETPTAGIHKVAFANAVRVLRCCQDEGQKGEPIRVLGPSFSGSHASLAAALKEIRTKPPAPCDQGAAKADGDWRPISVVCGSANGFDRNQFFLTWQQDPPAGRAVELREDRFLATIHSDSLVRRWLYRFLSNPSHPKDGSQPSPLVVLQESNTAFGRAAAPKPRKAAAPKPRKKRVQQATPSEWEEESAGREKLTFSVPFPLHISQLRAAYTKEQLARLQSLGLPQPARNIPLPQSEEDGRGQPEAVPVQAPLMTSALNDLVLADLLTAMAQKRARHVCLVASDTRDKIFLASLIRGRCPDVQLCTTGSDMLLAHPDYSYPLRGMVVASTYPLHPTVQTWSAISEGSDRHRILFANEACEGCYNAVLVHLAQMGLGSPEGDGPAEHMLDYGWVGDGPSDGEGEGKRQSKPGIWISAVGQAGQLVPLHYVSSAAIRKDLEDAIKGGSGEESSPEAKEEAKQAQSLLDEWQLMHKREVQTLQKDAGPHLGSIILPNMWSLLFVTTLLATAYFLYRGDDWITRSAWGPDLNDRMSCYKQRFDFTLACVAAMVLFSWLGGLCLVPLWHARPLDDFGQWLATLACALLSAGVILAAGLLVALAHRPPSAGGLWPALKGRLREYRDVILSSAPVGQPPDSGPARGRLGWLRGGGLTLVAADVLGLVCGLGLCLWLFGHLLVTGVWPLWHFLRRGVWPPCTEDTVRELLDFERLVYTANGLSPLLPVFLLCTAFFAWGLFLVKKQYLAKRFAVACPFPEDGRHAFQQLHRLDRGIRGEILPPSTWQLHPLRCLGLLLLLVVVFLKLWHESGAPLDGAWFGRLTLAAFFGGSFLLVFTLFQVYLTWARLKRMLRFLALLPMADAFGRLPHKVVSLFGHYFSSVRPRHSHLLVAVHQYELLRAQCKAFAEQVNKQVQAAAGGVAALEGVALAPVVRSFDTEFPAGAPEPLREKFDTELDAVDERDYESPTAGHAPEAAEQINELARKSLTVLQRLWPAHSMEEAFGRPPEEGKAAAATFLSLPEGHPVREWVRRAEDFVAVEVIRYLSQFFVQLRNLLTSLTVGALLLVVAAASYPFRPQSLLLLFLTALGGTVAVLIVVFLVQFNRDELVSRVTRTTPGRFTPDLHFVQGAATYVLPIVGALMVQFPFFASGVSSLVAPIVHIIR
jgi:hypothetical protein